MKQRHKHYDVIVALAEGKRIQYFSLGGWVDWVDSHFPSFRGSTNWRIKPEPEPDFSTYLTVSRGYTGSQTRRRYDSDTVKFTFDGETGKLKSAEVLE